MSDFLKTLNAWRRQRFAHALFVPVAMTLVLASLVGGSWPSILVLAARVTAAWVAVLALRLWDDLEDLQRDAQNHPERVLTRIHSTHPYFLAVAALLLCSGLLIMIGGGTAWVLLTLVGALWLFYRISGTIRARLSFVVLLKYPILVLALQESSQPINLFVLALILAAVSMDEVLQKTQTRGSTRKLIRGGLLAMTFATLLLYSIPKFAELIHAH
jgi:4-hydroxybenzoate polyprenyltransferase